MFYKCTEIKLFTGNFTFNNNNNNNVVIERHDRD